MSQMKSYQYYLDESLTHSEDCQAHNSFQYPDVYPQILDCVCDLMEKTRANEKRGEEQLEMERGN